MADDPTDTTTIGLTHRTKDRLDDLKRGGESYEAVIQRLLGDDDARLWTEPEVREVARQVAERAIEDTGDPL